MFPGKYTTVQELKGGVEGCEVESSGFRRDAMVRKS